MDLIDRSTLTLDGTITDIVEEILEAPTVDAVAVVQGKWIFDDFDGDGLDYQCSSCGGYSRQGHKHCPNCGSKMSTN